ncbi:MAG TPA: OmpA family protein [Polyangia bacterium]
MKFTSARIVGFGLGMGLTFGCSHAPPPQELIEARAIYARAANGPASQHAPARLRLAKQALSEAELSYGAAPQEEVQDRAYIAIRRAEAAEAEASAVAATERRSTALRELAQMSGVHADRARAELGLSEQRASEATARADQAQARVAIEQSRAVSAEQAALANQARAQQSESRLAEEQQARSAAEARAQQAMEQLSKLAQVKEESRGVVVTLSGQVLFVTDQAELLPAAQSSLDSVAATLKQIPAGSTRVTIEGHTDSTGQREYNVDLSRRRAQAVRDYLTSRGVRADLFNVAGIGPDRPVANNRTPEGRANNRRVEIIIPPSALALEKLPASTGTGSSASSGTTTPASGRDLVPARSTERSPSSARPLPAPSMEPPATGRARELPPSPAPGLQPGGSTNSVPAPAAPAPSSPPPSSAPAPGSSLSPAPLPGTASPTGAAPAPSAR